jgi:purine-binding chemotaxis protein CheW
MTMAALKNDAHTEYAPMKQFLTFTIDGHMLGIPILQVQDVLGKQRVTRVPLAPEAVIGSLNLRGRIVTAIDLHVCLGLSEKSAQDAPPMSIVVEHEGELYSLMIDKVGDVLNLSEENFEKTPATLDPRWRALCAGIYRLEGKLLVILDMPALFNTLETKLVE